MNTEYQIICFLKINEYRISDSTIQSQLFEYQIIRIIRSNSDKELPNHGIIVNLTFEIAC